MSNAGNPFFGRRPLNCNERKKVESLRRHAEYLERHIAEREGGPNPMIGARRELSAVKWAISVLGETPENEVLRAELTAMIPPAEPEEPGAA